MNWRVFWRCWWFDFSRYEAWIRTPWFLLDVSSEEQSMYMICDGANCVAFLGPVEVLGHEVTLPAIFASEEQALEVLFSIEERGLNSRPLQILRLSPTLLPVEAA